MEKNNKQNLKENNEEDEIILFSEGKGNTNEISQDSSSNQELLTLEEYYLECARFGELNDLITAMKDADNNFDVNLKDFRGNTALHMACANGHLEVVKYLVNTIHCDMNVTNNSLNTPISWAAMNGKKDVVAFLLAKGARFDIKNSQGKLPGEEAYDNGFIDISEMIIQKEIEMKKDIGIQEEVIDEVDNSEK